ncbi:MAG: methyltransferase type 11 [Sphingobacteriales bacterium]|nr:methyltransferase type 11 [Sphingobacteriales bacterium]
MDEQLLQIRDQQKASWNKFSPGWKKWDELMMDFMKPDGEEIIRLLQPKGNDIILYIASMLTGGKVFITDLAEDMLAAARENAEKKRY